MEDGASMLSTPTIKETDVQSPVTIDPEVVLAARADRAGLTAGADAARRPLDGQASYGEPAPIPALDTTFRPADLHGRRPAAGRSAVVTWALRTGLAVLVAVCSAVAAAAWQTYGDQAQEIVARWMPHVSLSTSADKDPAAPQAAAPTAPAPVNADDQTQAPPATAQAAEAAAPAPAPASTEPTQDSAQLLQSMAHDLTAMTQQIADLKASIAQLKAGQDQMVRDISRVAESKAPVRAAEAKPFDPRAIEQTLRPRPAARPPASSVAAAAPVHRPRPVYSAPAQPISAAPVSPTPMPLPSAPPQATSDPGVDAVVRPPMPVR